MTAIARDLQRQTLRKLELIHAAAQLGDLLIPPGNQLERLKGDLSAYHSVRVNKQWRICFMWTDGGAEDVTLVDYH
ncbi:type II toxin-antitoxin system RelE/ParE family toxin [Populibacterium corticicola]|uniref:Type II toxin-antitoxin system RelE/ParE family toxin n=1 Tax=Populibacterium corticicola TaxID=1812826 RepID=A0ABW5XFZ4_9MICO